MDKSFLKRLFGFGEEQEKVEFHAEEQQTPRIYQRYPLAEVQIAFYSVSQATVEILDYKPENAARYQLRLMLDYYAEALFRLGDQESAHQLNQYIGALCLHLLDDGELNRINILGALMELLVRTPTNAEIIHFQKSILYQNEDTSMETDICPPLLPTEYFLPTSVLLFLQHMLYTQADDDVAKLLMAISAMHTFYVTRHKYTNIEGRRLAVHHALRQIE